MEGLADVNTYFFLVEVGEECTHSSPHVGQGIPWLLSKYGMRESGAQAMQCFTGYCLKGSLAPASK